MTIPASDPFRRGEPVGWATFGRAILGVIFPVGTVFGLAQSVLSQPDNSVRQRPLVEALVEFRNELDMLETRQSAVAKALIEAKPQRADVEQAFANLRASVEDARMALHKLGSLLRKEYGSRGAEAEAVMDAALRAYDSWTSLDADYDRLISHKLSVVLAIQRGRAVWESAKAELAKVVGQSL